MKKLLFLALLAASTTFCLGGADSKAAIVTATKTYVAKNSAVANFNVAVEKIEGDYARAKVSPNGGAEADPAWVFLKKSKAGWTGVTMGTSFSPEDYHSLGIPEALWVK